MKIFQFFFCLFFCIQVEILEYFNKMNVIHNDLMLDNLFFRGSELFIGGKCFSMAKTIVSIHQHCVQFFFGFLLDFNLATLDGYQDLGHPMFKKKKRYPIEDLEALVYLMWEITGIGSLDPMGYDLFKNDMKRTAESKVMVSNEIIFKELIEIIL